MVESEKNLSEFLTVNGDGSLKTATILVVDADAVVCLNIQTQLKEYYHIISTHNGTEALQQIHQAHPNLILCSSLVKVSGNLSLLQALKQNPETEHIPVILLSGRESLGEIEVYDTQADDYLIKPFSSSELIARVRLQLKIVALRASAKRQVENLFLQAPVAICIFRGPTYIVELANENMLLFWDRNSEQVLNKPVFECMPDLSSQGFEELLDTVYKTGERFVTPEVPLTLMRHGKSENVFIKLTYEAMRDEGGSISGVMALAHEITDQVLARQRVEESEAFNRTVLESNPDCLKVIDGEGRIQYMNFNGQCLLEVDDFSTLKNKQWWEMWGEPNQKTVKDAVDKALGGEIAYFQAADFTEKGTPKWWDVIVSPVLDEEGNNKVSHIIAVSRDITMQKQEEIKLVESEQRFRNLVEKSTSAICILKGEDMVLVVANNPVFKVWDVGREALGKPFLEIIPEMKDQPFMGYLLDVYHNGVTLYGNEEPAYFTRKDGTNETIYFNFVYQPYRDDDGTISGVMVLATDVTEQVRARKKIEESELKFRSLIQEAPVATCLFTGREMTIELANEKMIGYWGKDNNVIGKRLEDAIPELKGQPFLQILDDVFTTGKTYHSNNAPAQLEIEGVLGTYYFDFTYKPLFNTVGEIYGIMDMAVDVTEQVLIRKKIEESEAHLRTMYDLMPAKITNADAAGGVNYCNSEWLNFTGGNFENFKNFGYQNIIHPDELDEFQKRFQRAAQTGTDLEMEMRFKDLDGEYIWHLNRASPVLDENGDIKMWIGVTTEIQKIKEEEQRKGEFLKMISHELKTPVTSVKGYVQFLLKTIKAEHEERLHPLPLKASLIRIDAQIIRLSRLISDILDLSRLEETKLELHLETFNLSDLLIGTIQDINQTNFNNITLLNSDSDCKVTADKDRISQVLINLITNAIKYSPLNKAIEVQILQLQKNQISVSVKDYGIGIDKKDQEKIFERFFRVEGKSENIFAGFGIGLFIANEIVRRHHGFISIESEKGKGSVFTFTLPCA